MNDIFTKFLPSTHMFMFMFMFMFRKCFWVGTCSKFSETLLTRIGRVTSVYLLSLSLYKYVICNKKEWSVKFIIILLKPDLKISKQGLLPTVMSVHACIDLKYHWKYPILSKVNLYWNPAKCQPNAKLFSCNNTGVCYVE